MAKDFFAILDEVKSKNSSISSGDRVKQMVSEDLGDTTKQNSEVDINAINQDILSSLPSRQKNTQEEQVVQGSQPIEKGNMLQSITSDMVRGYAESSVGLNRKLLAINDLINIPIFGKDEIHKRLVENVNYWENVSSNQKYRDPNGWLWGMLGSAPIAAAEFAGTGAGIGSLALRGGALQALDEYGRKQAEENGQSLTPGQFAGQFAQGAAITGTVGLAFKGAGVSLEKLGAFIPKYGKKVFKSMAESMGVPTKEIDGFLADPKKYMDKSPARYEDLYNKNKARVSDFIKKQENDLFTKKQELDRQQYEEIQKRALKIRNDEIARKEILDSKSEHVKQSIDDLREANRIAMQNLDMNNRDSIYQATIAHDGAMKTAKDAFDDQLASVGAGFRKTLDDYKGQVDNEIDNVLGRMVTENPSEGAKTSSVKKNILQALNDSRIFKASMKDGKFVLESRAGHKSADSVAKDIEDNLNSLINDYSENGIINMYKLRYNSQFFDRVLTKKWLQEGLGEATGFGAVAKKISSALDVIHYVDDLSPSAKKYVSELKSVYKKYGAMKDTINGFDSLLYRDTADSKGRVFNSKYVLNAMEHGDRSFLRELTSLENQSQFKISPELRKLTDNYKRIESEQIKFLMTAKAKADLAKKQASTEFRKSIRDLKKQGLAVTQEGKTVSALFRKMSDDNAKETYNIREAFDVKLNEFRKQQKADLEDLITKARAEDDFFKAKQIFQSWRPGGGFPRVAQNIGLYGTVGSTVAGATGAIGAGTAAANAVAKGGIAYVMSPVILAKMAQFSLKNKEIIKKASEKTIKAGSSIKNARLIQQLISKKIIDY